MFSTKVILIQNFFFQEKLGQLLASQSCKIHSTEIRVEFHERVSTLHCGSIALKDKGGRVFCVMMAHNIFSLNIQMLRQAFLVLCNFQFLFSICYYYTFSTEVANNGFTRRERGRELSNVLRNV